MPTRLLAAPIAPTRRTYLPKQARKLISAARAKLRAEADETGADEQLAFERVCVPQLPFTIVEVRLRSTDSKQLLSNSSNARSNRVWSGAPAQVVCSTPQVNASAASRDIFFSQWAARKSFSWAALPSAQRLAAVSYGEGGGAESCPLQGLAVCWEAGRVYWLSLTSAGVEMGRAAEMTTAGDEEMAEVVIESEGMRAGASEANEGVPASALSNCVGATALDGLTHAITLRGAQLSWAVLHGFKIIENRHFEMSPGWCVPAHTARFRERKKGALTLLTH